MKSLFMKWLAVAFGLMVLFGCGNSKKNEKKTDEAETGFDYETFSKHYAAASAPYQLSDTGLLQNKDTARLAASQLAPFVSDSIKKKLFGKTTGIRYIPLQKMEAKKGESYFITKAVSGDKTAALLTVFTKKHDTAASLLFLLPDDNANTTQVSAIDNSYSISRNVTQKEKNGVIIDGKEVYAYNPDGNNFTLIMTDVLDDQNQELINPIDTLPRHHRFSGDYVKDKKNIVSVRDGRNANELRVFVHIEKEDGTCTGELKGALFLTSSTTAVYRQGSDPCVMEFRFSDHAVMVKEDEGCGAHRGMTCTFNDTFPRKEAVKQKAAKKKPVHK